MMPDRGVRFLGDDKTKKTVAAGNGGARLLAWAYCKRARSVIESCDSTIYAKTAPVELRSHFLKQEDIHTCPTAALRARISREPIPPQGIACVAFASTRCNGILTVHDAKRRSAERGSRGRGTRSEAACKGVARRVVHRMRRHGADRFCRIEAHAVLALSVLRGSGPNAGARGWLSRLWRPASACKTRGSRGVAGCAVRGYSKASFTSIPRARGRR